MRRKAQESSWKATYEPLVHGLLGGEGGWGSFEDVGDGLLRRRRVGRKEVFEEGVYVGDVYLLVCHGSQLGSRVVFGRSKRRGRFVNTAKLGWGAGNVGGDVRHSE